MAEINKCFKAEIVDEIPFITLCDTNQLYIDYKKHRYILVWSGCHLVFYSIVSRNVVIVYEFCHRVIDVNSFKKSVIVLLEDGSFSLLDMPHSGTKKTKTNSSNGCTEVDNRSIFTNLLGDSAKKEGVCEEKTYETVRVDKHGIIFSISDAVGFVISGNCMVVLTCVKDRLYTIAGYNFNKLFGQALTKTDNSEQLVKEIFWRTSVECHDIATTHCVRSDIVLKGLQRKIPLPGRPKMFTCYNEHITTEYQVFHSSKAYLLNKQLFTSLFGVEFSLLECPVVLVCLPNGTVSSIPVAPLPSASPRTPAIFYQLSHPLGGIFPVHIQQGDVIETQTVVSSSKIESQGANSLLLLGLNGKVVLLYLVSNGSVREYEGLIPGPVYTCTSVGNTLIHSNLMDIFHTSFWLSKDGDLGNINSEPLGFHGSTMVASWNSKDGAEPLNLLDLLTLTHSGRMYLLEADLRKESSAVASTKDGHEIKDLLVSLGNVSLELDKVNARISQQDKLIEQLHLASLLASGYTSQNKSWLQDLPLSIHYRVESRDLGMEWIYTLVTELKVKSSHFNEHWFVTLKISPFMDLDIGNSSLNMAKTVKFLPTVVGQSQEVRLDLDKDKLCQSLPLFMCIDMTLCITPDGCMGTQHSTEMLTRHLSVPCFSGLVDIIDMLIPCNSFHNTNQTEGISGLGAVASILTCLKKSRPLGLEEVNAKVMSKENKVESLESFTGIVEVPHNFVQALLKQKQGHKSAENQLLRMLMNDNQLLTDVCRDSDQVKAYSPSGHQVNLSVCSPISQSGRRSVEVHIQAFCPSDMSVLRYAITSRLQKLSKNVDEETCSLSVSTQSMRRYLRELEEIHSEVEALRHSRTCHSQQDVKKIYHLFNSLRNTSLKAS